MVAWRNSHFERLRLAGLTAEDTARRLAELVGVSQLQTESPTEIGKAQ